MSCANEITFFLNLFKRVRLDAVTKFTCMCSKATKSDSVKDAAWKRLASSSCGKLHTGSMWFRSPNFSTSAARAPPSFRTNSCSSRTWQRWHCPLHSSAMSGDSSGADGSSSHSATAMLHGARPSAPGRSRSSFTSGGGANAGWNAGKRFLHVLHVKSTIRVSIVCFARTASKGRSFNATSNFATRKGNALKGSMTTCSRRSRRFSGTEFSHPLVSPSGAIQSRNVVN